MPKIVYVKLVLINNADANVAECNHTAVLLEEKHVHEIRLQKETTQTKELYRIIRNEDKIRGHVKATKIHGINVSHTGALMDQYKAKKVHFGRKNNTRSDFLCGDS